MPSIPSDPTFAHTSVSPRNPLLMAALAGLLGVACGDDEKKGDDSPFDGLPDTEQDAGADGATDDAGAEPQDAGDAPEADAGATPEADAGPTGPIVTNEVPGQRTYASLEADCDALGGFIQLHAACAGVNSCKGFSYGDWGEGSVLTEHTCAAMNGCNGLSCVVLPEDTGKTGADVYSGDLPPGGPQSCLNCHAVWNDDGTVDATKFKLWLAPGSTRTAENWLDVPAAEQAKVVAFGRNNVLPDGSMVVGMVGYHKLYARAEIERAVEHIRTLTPIVSEIKKPE